MKILIPIFTLVAGLAAGYFWGRNRVRQDVSPADREASAVRRVQTQPAAATAAKARKLDGEAAAESGSVAMQPERRQLPEVQRRNLERTRLRLEHEARAKERREARESPELHAARVAYEGVRAREETPALRQAREAFEQRVRFEETLEAARLGPNARRHRGNFKNQQHESKEMYHEN